MSTGTRLPLADAQRLALQLLALLGDSCERIEIAGSVRRQLVIAAALLVAEIERLDRAAQGEGALRG